LLLKQSVKPAEALVFAKRCCGFGFTPRPPGRYKKSGSESLRVRRLRLGVPKFLFHLIALIKLVLRLRSQARIGVRSAGNKIQRAKGRGSALQRKLQPWL